LFSKNSDLSFKELGDNWYEKIAFVDYLFAYDKLQKFIINQPKSDSELFSQPYVITK